MGDTFSAFGVILTTPKIQRDPDSGNSKCYAFIHYANFEASDFAIDSMNGQFLCNRALSIQYAFKDSSHLRHGSAAERFIAAKNPISQAAKPHQLFADSPNIQSNLSAYEEINGMRIGIMPPRGPPRLPPPQPPRLPMLPPVPPGLTHPNLPGERFGTIPKLPMPPLPFSTLPPRPKMVLPQGSNIPPPPGTGLQQSGSVQRNSLPITAHTDSFLNSHLKEVEALKRERFPPNTEARLPLPPWMNLRGEIPRPPSEMLARLPNGTIPRPPVGIVPRLPNGVPPPPPWLRPGGSHFRPPMPPVFRPPLPTGPPPG